MPRFDSGDSKAEDMHVPEATAGTSGHVEDHPMTFTHPGRLAMVALFATIALGACSGGAASTAPSAATSAAPSAAGSVPAGSGAAVACAAGSITAAGSTALQPLIDAAAKKYQAACVGSTVQVQGGGSGTGLTQVLQGAVQIGNSDVTADSKLKPEEAAQLVDHVVARQGWVMVVSKDVTGITNLTSAQATDIWTGKIKNWKEVGGPDVAIVLILRPASSGTRSVFKKVVLNGATEAAGQALTEDSNGAVTAAVKTTPGSTSVIGFAFYQANKADLTALQLDGIDASVDNMLNDTYKLQAFGHSYTKGEASGLAASFIAYVLSPDIQQNLLKTLFYAPASK
jgi:phosphate transport system substrate-binding protein